jgi:nicotinate-nucleotide adenylyltransferase
VRTGILGGTFDPIHVAHLHSAECALHQLELDRVLVIPAGDPWQKSGRWVSKGVHRLEMCRRAVAGVDRIFVDSREVERDGPTFTIDTLATFPDDEELFVVLGADSAAGFESWHRWEEVLSRATIAIAPRPGIPRPEIEGAVDLEMGMLEISGTEIRERIRDGRPYRYLVTEPVYDYIGSHDLYANGVDDDMVVGLSELEDSS